MLRIHRKLDSETLHLPELKPLIGQTVEITVEEQPVSLTTRGLADVIDEIRRRQHARAFQGRSAEEIEAVRQEGEAEYEQRMQALHSAGGG